MFNYLYMKKFAYFIIVFFMLTATKGQCLLQIVDDGTIIINGSTIEKRITVNSVAMGTLGVKALSNALVKTGSNPVSIPLSYFYVIANDGLPTQMSTSSHVNIYSKLTGFGSVQVVAKFQLQNIPMLTKGDYYIDIEYYNRANNFISSSSTVQTLIFRIPEDIKLTGSINTAQITLTPADVFSLNVNKVNDVDTRLNITSNTPWKLVLDASAYSTPDGEHDFRVKGSSSNVTVAIPTRTKITSNSLYEIANGPATIQGSSGFGTYNPTYVDIEYHFKKQSEDRYVQEGNLNTQVKYLLQEKP